MISIYDEVAFPSYPYPASHPERLATIARLCGLATADIQNCRVLELGCGTAGNLLPMADTLPDSQFLGLDLSEQQIALGQEQVTAVGLNNIRLQARDILTLDDSLGEFDYVIAHGLYSWTTEPVRKKLLGLLPQILSKQGVAYVNYNAYPGWHMQGMLRDMLWLQAKAFPEPGDRVREARRMIEFLHKTLPPPTTPFGALVRSELDAIQKNSDAFLFHAYLNVFNQPYYFQEFQQRAESHELRVVGDAEPDQTWPELASPALGVAMKQLNEDATQWPQLHDFVRCSTSRRSLLCSQDATVVRGPVVAALHDLHYSAPLQRVPNEPATFAAPNGRRVTANDLSMRATFELLAEVWPGSVSYETLHRRHAERLEPIATTTQSDTEQTRNWEQSLLQCFCNNIIQLSVEPFRGATTLQARPFAPRYARYQAKRMDFVANLRHQAIRLSQPELNCLALSDGSRTIEQLSAELQSPVQESLGRLLVNGLLVCRD